jgi:hypothetical protein
VLDPGTALLYVAGGDLAIARGNPQLAEQDYATATALAANSKADTSQILAHECQAEVLRHQYVVAITDCATAAQLSSSGAGAYDNLAEANLSLGRLTPALTSITEAISNFIGNVGPYAQPEGVDGFGLANLYAARGWIEIQLGGAETGAAISDFENALQSLPGAAPDTRARIKSYVATAKKDQ